MKILMLGGTVFLGRHLVEAALARGHEVTVFHRGVHEVKLTPKSGSRSSEERSLSSYNDIALSANEKRCF